ncbi:MAG: SUMF1/EgtB/PvdO family nonheme iron enzyme [Gemmatimonadota bacterium]
MATLRSSITAGALALALLMAAGPARSAAAAPATSVAPACTVHTPTGPPHELVLVPAGEFDMGSTAGHADETPVHRLFLDAFYLDRVPVTNAQYLAFLNDRGASESEDGSPWLDLGDPDAQITRDDDDQFALIAPDVARRPVVEVSWYGAQAYCAWAGLRLPTEAEWEKAARGDDHRTYPWGEEIDSTRANYGHPEGSTHDVGSHPAGASPYGIHDMAGNVRNWTADYYTSDYYAGSPPRNPPGPETSRDHVMRGGGYLHDATEQRAAFRLGAYSSFTDAAVGFRCARNAVAGRPPSR